MDPQDDTQRNLMAMYGDGAGSRPVQKPFVDSVDDDVARLIMPDGKTQEVPRSSLPPDIKEGQYLGATDDDAFDIEQQARQTGALRKKLAADDDGGDIKL